MNIAYLSLGSNQKGPERQIRQALKLIKSMPVTSILNVSKLYWSKAWGNQAQQDFCNAVVKVATDLTPELLLCWCKNIEKKHGRVRKIHWGPRTLDIDIILYGKRTIHNKNLTIPHPYFLERDFVLTPLKEINYTLT